MRMAVAVSEVAGVVPGPMSNVSASTKTMLAPGAMAWAHSTSRAVSIEEPMAAVTGERGSGEEAVGRSD